MYYNVGHSPLQTVIVEVLSSGLRCTVGDEVHTMPLYSSSPEVTLAAAPPAIAT